MTNVNLENMWREFDIEMNKYTLKECERRAKEIFKGNIVIPTGMFPIIYGELMTKRSMALAQLSVLRARISYEEYVKRISEGL